MKIKGKEIKEYFDPKHIGMDAHITTKDLAENLEKNLEESLDDFVLELQTRVYDNEKARHSATSNETQIGCYHYVNAYLDTIEEINKIFGTNYAQSIEKVVKHFETKTPAKD